MSEIEFIRGYLAAVEELRVTVSALRSATRNSQADLMWLVTARIDVMSSVARRVFEDMTQEEADRFRSTLQLTGREVKMKDANKESPGQSA